MVALSELHDIDRWALNRLNEVRAQALADYDAYEFHGVFHALHNFCVVDMSNFYLDIIKDRLYVEKTDSVTRRSAQTAIYLVLSAITRLMAPILAFTCEEIWKFLPMDGTLNAGSVMLNSMPEQLDVAFDDAQKLRFERLLNLRADVQKALEEARGAKVIGASLEAKLIIHAENETFDFLSGEKQLLPHILIVSQVEIEKGGVGKYKSEDAATSFDVAVADGEKCERCWSRSTTVGSDARHPTLCARCAEIIG